MKKTLFRFLVAYVFSAPFLMAEVGNIYKVSFNDEKTGVEGVTVGDRFYTFKEYIVLKTGCAEYDLVNISSARKYKNSANTYHYAWVECLKHKTYHSK